VVTKPKPKLRKTGQEPSISAAMTPPSSTRTSSAKNSVV
jgi:hypothetical protein